MKNTKTARAPKGFRLLKETEVVKAGDRFSYCGFSNYDGNPVGEYGAIKIGDDLRQAKATYLSFDKGKFTGKFTGQVIRRIPTKRPATRKGGKRK